MYIYLWYNMLGYDDPDRAVTAAERRAVHGEVAGGFVDYVKDPRPYPLSALQEAAESDLDILVDGPTDREEGFAVRLSAHVKPGDIWYD